ncbi:MAG: hypothetical protein LBL86_03030 [Coriobacteriales bacterium]|jgi:hypothetical protein|nr:hypothetical protein [Coriobacteriales bacterium]
MATYEIEGQGIDSVELKCLLVSRGVKVDKSLYKSVGATARLSMNPLCCNCLILSDGTIAQLTDLSFHLRLLAGMLSWSQLKLLRYASDLDTPFALKPLLDGDVEKVGLFWKGELLDFVSFPPHTGFYEQRTSGGLRFVGNTVLQGLDWVAFQCLWPCEYAAAGKPCEFCFSGADFETLQKKGKPLPAAVCAADVADVVAYAVQEVGVSHLQITGGSTFDGASESAHIRSYLEALAARQEARLPGETLLYITPPTDTGLLDEYFALGASRVACSLELWDEQCAEAVTAGKMAFTTRERHLRALEYVARRYGPAKAFSNFIIGIEDFETLAEGARYLAERGVLPTASVWMPMGRPVQGSMKAPDIDYYRRVKELFAELYVRHGLEPTASRGLNVCIERDIWNYAQSA